MHLPTDASALFALIEEALTGGFERDLLLASQGTVDHPLAMVNKMLRLNRLYI